jgi:hypothetical protein
MDKLCICLVFISKNIRLHGQNDIKKRRICFWAGDTNRTDTHGRIIRKTVVVRENQWGWSVVFFVG